MASVNKIMFDAEKLRKLYVEDLMSLPFVAKTLGASISTVRARLLEMGLLRGRAQAIRIAQKQGRLGAGNRGKKRVFTQEWKQAISSAARRRGEENAKGVSLKPSGYLEHTRGPEKGRSVHVTIIEAAIGRRLFSDEVAHHIDHDRANNDPANLQLMTRSEHARLHAIENTSQRKRAANGKFE